MYHKSHACDLGILSKILFHPDGMHAHDIFKSDFSFSIEHIICYVRLSHSQTRNLPYIASECKTR